ncbi:beta-1,3-glucan-binding protein 2-like [Schistocerca gregaria]|uniref:beta-1,3-glucan-binding protein 2-like n=1 Tax=Schistocerca gregaria TaxID=7010 RepID=UPI00211EFABE|nr:beta-1,3-glucan-binding protein 2-like [Schistocerca gregaria]
MALLRVLVRVLAAVVLGQRAALAEGVYSVPEPHIQALRPKGVRFSIPDEPGLELFAVHANVNKEMRDLEAGQLSADVVRPRDGRWVFEDQKTALRPGDRINYWLYVKRDGLGFRRDGGTFTVTELVDKKAPASPPLGSSQHCPQGCPHEGVSGGAVDPLTEQRLRHAEELHQQRMRHAEELHRERLHQLQQQQQQRAGHGADGVGPGADVQDVSAFKRIGSRR